MDIDQGFNNEINKENQEMMPDDFLKNQYIKNPQVGEEIEFVVDKIINNLNTTGKNPTTGKEFSVGVKDKSGKVKRIDIYTKDKKVWTCPNWEIYFKLFGPTGLLIEYSKNHNKSFSGAIVTIKKLIDGSLRNLSAENVAKILGVSKDEAEEELKKIKVAIDERRLYEVSVKNI